MEFIIRKFDLFKLIFFNKAERDFVNLKHPYKIDKKNNKIVLVEIGLDIYFLVHFYFLLKERKFRNNKFVGLWINPMRMRRPGFTGTIAFLFQCLVQYLIKLKWMKIYKCLGFNSFIDLSNDFKDSIFISKSNFVKSYKSFKKKEDILKLKYQGIKIGDLIYDHYLRFKGDVKFNINDLYSTKILLNMIEGANNNLNNFYLKNKNKIEYYIPQKAFYINGFAIRYFLNKNIKTIGGIENIKYVKKFTKKDYLAGTRSQDLKKKFIKLKNKTRKKRLAKKYLKEKFDGKINKEFRYMRQSTFSKNLNSTIKKTFDVVIFLPDFSDAPHIYGDLVFNDYSDWIEETLKFLKEKNISIAIKKHPNTWVFSSKKYNEELKEKYNNLIWLDKDISNNEIFKKKPKFGISPFGTVLHELAYHKIIPISVGANPHMAYDFVFTPKNKNDYFNFINKAIKGKLKLKNNVRDKIAECYYMYHLHNDDYFKNRSRDLQLQNYLPAIGVRSIEILEKFNKGDFNK
tara:strand:- start:7462 stop:9003 length:1542 start_codon:yes stop_codon:yes gene_type:complete